MADNYLEKQYAEYEARKAAWEKARKFGTAKKKAASSTQEVSKPDDESDEITNEESDGKLNPTKE